MRRTHPVNRTVHGFTIIELMIAIVIASILMLGVIQIFGANKRSHVIGSGLARVQENIRFAMKEISFASRMAGFVGCSGNVKNHLDTADSSYSDDLFNFASATGGWEFSSGAATSATQPGQSYTITSLAPDPNEANWDNNAGNNLPASLDNQVLPGTDVFVLKWAGSNTGVTVKNMNPTKAAINTQGASNIPQGTILIVSDCSGGDVFQNVSESTAATLSRGTAAGSTVWQPGNANPATSDWSHNYTNGAEMLYFVSRAFYIGQGRSSEPALFRITYTQGATGPVTEELAEGIENMQVLFGIDTGTDNYADRYVTAQDVTSHDKVVALKVALLARTPDEIKQTASSGTYNLLGTNITTQSDRRLRYVFTTTFKLRNKGVK